MIHILNSTNNTGKSPVQTWSMIITGWLMLGARAPSQGLQGKVTLP